MKILKDFLGRNIRLTDERLQHILEHPELVNMEIAIEETLKQPQFIVKSISDSNAELYYRFYSGTIVGDKWLCVVVKHTLNDAFILTAYLTEKIKKGIQLWPQK